MSGAAFGLSPFVYLSFPFICSPRSVYYYIFHILSVSLIERQILNLSVFRAKWNAAVGNFIQAQVDTEDLLYFT